MSKQSNSGEWLDDLDGNERQRLFKRAAKMRKAAQGRGSRRSRASTRDWLEKEETEAWVKVPRRASGTLQSWVEQIVAQEGLTGGEGLDGSADDAVLPDPVLVTAVAKGVCTVRMADGTDLTCPLSSDLAIAQRTDIAVGDRVIIVREDDETCRVVAVEPRRSTLSRPDPGGGARPVERILAANVDTVVIVAAVKSPPLRPRLIDRFLIAAQRGGARPVICVNKIDLVDPEQRESELSVLDPYRELGVPVIGCSATEKEGLDPLRHTLSGETVVFAGHSGVGKSSLLVALGDFDIRTGSVGDFTGKGRHTTTASQLYELPGGTRIIDTPGIRQLGIGKLSIEELAAYFPEFDEPRSRCRFADCTHRHEPKCGVKQAVEEGTVPAMRYDTYQRLCQEAE